MSFKVSHYLLFFLITLTSCEVFKTTPRSARDQSKPNTARQTPPKKTSDRKEERPTLIGNLKKRRTPLNPRPLKIDGQPPPEINPRQPVAPPDQLLREQLHQVELIPVPWVHDLTGAMRKQFPKLLKSPVALPAHPIDPVEMIEMVSTVRDSFARFTAKWA